MERKVVRALTKREEDGVERIAGNTRDLSVYVPLSAKDWSAQK